VARPLYPRRNPPHPGVPLGTSVGGQSRSGRCGVQKNFLFPGTEPQPVARRYTDWAIPLLVEVSIYSMYPEGSTAGHFDTGFSLFSSIFKQNAAMIREFQDFLPERGRGGGDWLYDWVDTGCGFLLASCAVGTGVSLSLGSGVEAYTFSFPYRVEGSESSKLHLHKKTNAHWGLW
jgi:hypothetical protein